MELGLRTIKTHWQRYLSVWLALGCLVAASGANAEALASLPMRFDRLGAADGLAQNSVMSVTQDASGFIWFATENGLNRYDGKSLLHFKYDRSDANSLPADYVTDIEVAPDDTLWVSTDGGGIARWNPETAGFDRVTRSSGLSDNKVQLLVADNRGNLWIGTLRDGLNRLNLETGDIEVFRNDPENDASLSNNSVRAIWIDDDGTVWIGTNKGLDQIDPRTGAIRRVAGAATADTQGLSGSRVRTIMRDASGGLWVGTQRGGLSRSDDDGESFRHFKAGTAAGALSNNRVEALLQDREGRIWVATADGLNLYQPDLDRFLTYRYAADEPSSLSDNNVISLFQDRGNLLWIGTKTAGVNKWNPRTWSFGHVRPADDDDGNHRIRHVTSFADATNAELWFGSFGAGLTRVDTDGNVLARVTTEGDADKTLADDRVMALAGSGPILWVGTMTGGLNRLDTHTGLVRQFRAQKNNPDSLAADGIMSLLLDSRGRFWIGTFGGGVDRLDPGSERFVHYSHDADDVRALASPRATSITETQDGRIWVGTDGGGLHRLSEDETRWERIDTENTSNAGFVSAVIYALHVDETGTLWAGTRDGLYRSDQPGTALAELTFRVYDDGDGLADDHVYGIRSDADGQIWVSTNRGLSSLDPLQGTVRNYSVSHGLQAFEFNFGAHFESADGRLVFGGPNGFNAFDPNNLALNSVPPRVALTGLELLSKPLRTSDVYDTVAALELEYTDDAVTFEFAALDFAAPDENRFAYKLEGFDRDWVDAGNERRTTYTNLSGGHYTFLVRAANSDGVWADSELTLDIRVEPPPWLTPWAYLAYSMLLAALAFGIWHAQERKLKQRAEYSRRLEREVDQRTREIADRNRELELANGKLHEASYTDPLTGLRNRRYFFEQIGAQLDKAAQRPAADRRENTEEYVFLMIDLDHFKPVNDTHGHQAGDQLLLGVSKALEQQCRSSDTVIRWGGDEFLMVARRAGSDEASHLAERIRAAVASSVFQVSNGHVARTTSSIGYASFPFFDHDPARVSWEQTLKIADVVMYRAKAQRNSWCGVVGVDYPHGIDTMLEQMHQDLDEMHEQGHVIVTEAIREATEKIA